MTRNFNVSGFRLPTAMVFSASTSAPIQLSGGIATTSDGAKTLYLVSLCKQLVHNSVFDGRKAVPLANCIVFGNTVTALCTNAEPNMCRIDMNLNIEAIEDKYLSILESLKAV
ncbi:hypothetical protein KIN20_003365 [Parelaphostrongylus tenuis]|uniref:Uncharacterized protein n=1 Tax=Parelaphostrongylus tenuis TaxID=148309 RepID=A0AAD5QDN8_PARTN|nr:hypothetical protein KIN20_003365 [Parelaphostrongylus tenuis]